MKPFLFFALLFVFTHPIHSQELSGMWKGRCEVRGYIANLTLNITHLGGTKYKVNGTEKNSKGTVTFRADFFLAPASGTATIKNRRFTNVVAKDTGGRIVEGFDFRDSNSMSRCLCDDDLSLLFGFDNTYNYIEAECEDDIIRWDVSQVRPKKTKKPVP
jgi:hypothetical protein